MIVYLIGHRGVGKTELAKRWKSYLDSSPSQQSEFFDLDQEIEKTSGKSIQEIFQTEGELAFRVLEKKVFKEIKNKLIRASKDKITFISLGAGFEFEQAEEERVIWVQRATDAEGRVFLNRPRLNQELTALEEYLARYEKRQESYLKWCSEFYFMPEGDISRSKAAQKIEREILTDKISNVCGVLTVLPGALKTKKSIEVFLKKYSKKEITFELRDDLLNLKEMEQIIKLLHGERILYSFRKERGAFFDLNTETVSYVKIFDWALELSISKSMESTLNELAQTKEIVFSFHGKYFQSLKTPSFFKGSAHLKCSPEVFNYKELQELYDWWLEDSIHRSVLPRSSTGRWSWFRLKQKGHQKLNFWREGLGSALDQPSLFQWQATPFSPRSFAAVLGSPVFHSFSPLEQLDFFNEKGIPFWAIDVSEEEWEFAIEFLKKLGLSWVAVTSPLKQKAGQLAKLGPVNTLSYDHAQKMWTAVSTDEYGAHELWLKASAKLKDPLVVVWGGGGVLDALRKSLPQNALFFSARTGKVKNQEGSAVLTSKGPQVLIWAAVRSSSTQWPPEEWRPEIVMDLNYKEDSMGKEYAQKKGCQYLSGLEMFYHQAQKQREFWRGRI